MRQKPRVVITGVAGFIGSNLAYGLLSEGYQVIGIDDFSAGLPEQVPEGVEFEQLDIRVPDLAARFRPGDIVFVDDVNEFHLRCMEDPRSDGQVYNVGSGSNYSIREIYDAVQSLMKTDIEPIFKPDLPGEAIETLADIRAARSLGWEPRVD